MIKIATIHTDFPEKFGIPRQSGLVEELSGVITFEKAFADPAAVRGLEGFSHIWLLWKFDVPAEKWHPTVRPPRLGGNTHMGVFATRSPFRPNPIGLSCVRLERVEISEDGPVLYVRGADLRDGTAILDIKPYLPYADARPDATSGWAKEAGSGPKEAGQERLKVHILPETEKALSDRLSEDQHAALMKVLAQDPRPAYQEDPDREYGLLFAGVNVVFTVAGGRLSVIRISDDIIGAPNG